MKFPSSPRIILVLFLLSGLMVSMGCSSQVPTPKITDPEAPVIPVNGSTLPTISFDDVYADIPGGRIIGYVHEGMQNTRTFETKWDDSFNNETKSLNLAADMVLKQAGYLVEDHGNGEILMKGTIRRLKLNSYSYKGKHDEAECEMKWELFRAGEDTPYFTKSTVGNSRVKTVDSGAIKVAFEFGLRRLLAEEEFVEAIRTRK